jgi:hypothetical protein
MAGRAILVDAPDKDYGANVVAFLANVRAGHIFLAVNEVDVDRDDDVDSSAAYLTPDAAEELALGLIRLAHDAREGR